MTHIPVMLEEAIDVLVHRSDGTYVDCTFGRGGHATAILKRLSVNGRLIVMDKDPEAIDDFYQGKIATANFYMAKLLPQIDSLKMTIKMGSDCLINFPDDSF